MTRPRPRQEHAQPAVAARPASYLVRARSETPAWRWHRARRRCRELLPTELAWAAPLLRDQPQPVLCGELEAETLARWLDALPPTAQITITYDSRCGASEPIVAPRYPAEEVAPLR